MKRKLTKIAVILIMLTLVGCAFVYDSILSGTLLTIMFGGLWWVGKSISNFKIRF